MGNENLYECGKCGATLQKQELKIVEQLLYGQIKEKKMKCPHCNSMIIYYKDGPAKGRYTNAYAYINQL